MPATCDRCGDIHDTYRFALERAGIPVGYLEQPWDGTTCEWDSSTALDAATDRLTTDGATVDGFLLPTGGGTAINDQGDEVGWDDDQPVDGTIILT